MRDSVRRGGERTKIVVIEPDGGIAQIFEHTLRLKGYGLRVGRTGKEGIDIFTSEKEKVALVDLEIKDIEGRQVVTELLMGNPNAIIGVMSERGELKKEMMNIGVNRFFFQTC